MKKQILLILSITTILFSCSINKNSTQTKEAFKQSTIPTNKYTLNKSKLDSLFEVLNKNDKFMGSIALSYNGTIIYTNAIGFDDIETQKISTINTKYRIGSISKVYTASLILKAAEEHKLSLEQTIDAYFPNIENAQSITIENLLNHRSGIHSFTNDKTITTYHTSYKSPQEILEIISKYDSDFAPNSKTQYSNSNYVLLTLILEIVYQSSFKDLITEKICKPLNLENTYYGSKINLANNECNSYKYLTSWTKQTETNMSIPMGAGSIVSTPSELTKFMDLLFNEKIISKKSIEKMTTINDNHGMGIMRFSLSDRKSFGHHGSIDGFTSIALYFPKEKLAIALTSNGSNNNKDKILAEILKQYFNDAIVEITEADMKNYVGVYYSFTDKSDKFTFLQNKNVLILEMKEDMEEALIYKGNHRFVFEQVYAESMSFTFLPDTKQLTVEQGNYEGIFNKE